MKQLKVELEDAEMKQLDDAVIEEMYRTKTRVTRTDMVKKLIGALAEAKGWPVAGTPTPKAKPTEGLEKRRQERRSAAKAEETAHVTPGVAQADEQSRAGEKAAAEAKPLIEQVVEEKAAEIRKAGGQPGESKIIPAAEREQKYQEEKADLARGVVAEKADVTIEDELPDDPQGLPDGPPEEVAEKPKAQDKKAVAMAAAKAVGARPASTMVGQTFGAPAKNLRAERNSQGNFL